MKRFIRDVLISGLAGGALSHLAVVLSTRDEHGRYSDAPMHPVSHMVWGDDPENHPGETAHNWVIGSTLHHGASMFWATCFEALFGRDAERSTSSALVGGTAVAAMAYIVDYHVVPDRLKPGFDAHLSNRALGCVYAGLALGMALGARLRGLYRHQIEDNQKRDKGRDAERGPDPMEAPEARR